MKALASWSKFLLYAENNIYYHRTLLIYNLIYKLVVMLRWYLLLDAANDQSYNTNPCCMHGLNVALQICRRTIDYGFIYRHKSSLLFKNSIPNAVNEKYYHTTPQATRHGLHSTVMLEIVIVTIILLDLTNEFKLL